MIERLLAWLDWGVGDFVIFIVTLFVVLILYGYLIVTRDHEE